MELHFLANGMNFVTVNISLASPSPLENLVDLKFVLASSASNNERSLTTFTPVLGLRVGKFPIPYQFSNSSRPCSIYQFNHYSLDLKHGEIKLGSFFSPN
jgi:hypothetical protein